MSEAQGTTIDTHGTADATGDDHVTVSPPAARLTIVSSPDPSCAGRVIELGDATLSFGREIDAHGYSLADRRMSRLHARVAFDRRAGAYRVGDAQSRNGTWVNGRKVDTVLLSDGDVLRIGDSLLVYGDRDWMQQARARANALAPSGLHILLRGETGTGKEVMARTLHAGSGRPGELIAVNCATIPKDLVAAELFGHTKNAFSGALQARRGVFMAAQGGSLLLDEIADCPFDQQPALLRALQERAIRPVGAEREQAVDVRVISATCLDLELAVHEGRFRADLYARLAQATITLPPLRARRSELLALADELTPASGPSLRFSPDAAEALLLWPFPLNVRELQSLVAVAAAELPSGQVDLNALAGIAPKIAEPIVARQRTPDARARTSTSRPPSAATPTRNLGANIAASRAQLRPLLEAHDGNVAAVAQALGKPRAQVYRWMRVMGLSPDRFRSGR